MQHYKFPGFDAPIDQKLWRKTVQIPDRIFSIDGQKSVSVNLDSMDIPSDESGQAKIRFLEKLGALSEQTRLSAASILIHALDGRRKTSTVLRWLSELSLFSRSVSELLNDSKVRTITTGMYDWYAGIKGASQTKLLRSLLLYWSSTGAPGIQPELIVHLNSTSPKAPRGMIEVQNDVPAERPFSKSQIHSLLKAIQHLYITREFNSQENLLWRAMVSEALRPTQLRLLQFGDFRIDKNNNSSVTGVHMTAPMVKQAATAARSYMTEHRLSHALAQAYLDHLESVAEILGRQPPKSWPVFCLRRSNSANQSPSTSQNGISINNLIKKTRTKIVKIAGEFDETDLFSRRLKHTKLTNLAAAGASDEVLAHAGYQTSTISLRRYVNLTDEAFASLEEMLEDSHQAIADAFSGRVIDPDDATFADPEHLVMDLTLEDPVGACGADPCGVLACLGCYVCHKFKAFRDGPHDRVEAAVLARREKAREAGTSPEAIEMNGRILAGIRHVIRIIAAGQ